MRCWISIFALLGLVTTVNAAVLEVPGEYASVQAAVTAAASGDTVRVAAGLYEEQVVITLPLLLQGAGADLTTIQAPVDLPHDVGRDNYRAVICVDEAGGDVTVEALTVDGLGRQPADGSFVGIMFFRHGGTARHIVVRNLHHTPTDDQQSGIGILASLDAPTVGPALTLADVLVTRFQKTGVMVASRSSEVLLTRVTVDADGLVTDAVQNGIELNTATNSRVDDCRVVGLTHDGEPAADRTAAGLLAINCTDLVIDRLEASQCLTAIYLEGTSAQMSDVEIDQPAPSLVSAHGLVSVTGPIETTTGGLPAPSPTMAGPISSHAGGLSIYEVSISDSRLAGDLLAGSAGIGLNTFSARAQRLVLQRCEINGWDQGIHAGEDPTLFGAVFGRFSGCRLGGNLSAGIMSDTITPLDARGCLWGDASGPYHPESNPDGSGDVVSDNVMFDPWLTGNLAPLPVPQNVSLNDFDGLGYTDTISVEYLGGGDQLLYGFSASLTWDPALVTALSVEAPSRGEFTSASWFFTEDDEVAGSVRVDAALGGAHPGMARGPLFTVTFRAVGTPDGDACPVLLELHNARDGNNQPVTGLATDPGLLVVDLQAPVISQVTLTNETLPHTDAFAKDGDQVSVIAQITDGHPDFGRGDIRGVGAPIYGAPWVFGPPDEYDGTEARWHARTVLTDPVGNGERAFQVSAMDPAGNGSEISEGLIIIDNIAPEVVTGLTATAGHNHISLAWDSADQGDLHHRHTVVRANPWGDHPHYAAPAPDYPVTSADGDSVYTGPNNDVEQLFAADGSQRDILYFGVMAEDMAGNVSPAATARTTSYRVGDLAAVDLESPGDGAIDASDLARLDAALGRSVGEEGFDAFCDVAPADSTGPVIPEPDTTVDLDDLMLVAMRHDHQGSAATVDTDNCPLTWATVAPDTFVLVLTDTCEALKGLSVVVDGGEVAWSLLPGDLLLSQPGPWFLSQGPGGGRADLAVLGPEVGVVGTGELLRLVSDQPAAITSVVLDLRDLHNQPLDHVVVSVPDEAAVPARFQVTPPYPNPFNPVTTIAFDLPRRQMVHLDIFALNGRRVRRLLTGDVPAGRHRVAWLGRDDAGRAVASGTYIFRLEAGPWSATGKLGLVK